MNVLLWHVHGSWTTAFVHGSHRYLVPAVPGRGPDGRGRADTYVWPDSAVEVTPADVADAEVDVVILQRPHELSHLAREWLGGREPGRDLPAVYVEHNAPQGEVNAMRHVAADRRDLLVVHVTHFNDLFWDCGTTPTTVVEHGIVDPGDRYTGELARAVAVVNEAPRRARVTGTDVLRRIGARVPVDLFGMDAARLGGEELVQERLHGEMARRRVYVHPNRWTSLGLSRLEAMHLGMPVVAVAATEVVEAVPPGAGVVSTDVARLETAIRAFLHDPAAACEAGRAARAAALARYGLTRFLVDWDDVLARAVAEHPVRRRARVPLV